MTWNTDAVIIWVNRSIDISSPRANRHQIAVKEYSHANENLFETSNKSFTTR